MKPTLVSQAHPALIALFACLAALLYPAPTHAAAAWDAPATQLAGQIAAILGPGQAQLELTNRSAIPAADLPIIRQSLEDALRTHGIRPGSTESANTVRITLSENDRESLWVAEILEGNQHPVTMVHFAKQHAAPPASASGITLERKQLWSSSESDSSAAPILAALEWNNALVLLSEDHLSLFTRSADRWVEAAHQQLTRPAGAHLIPREPRGQLGLDSATTAITAYLPGWRCTSTLLNNPPQGATQENATCIASDDPWPLTTVPPSAAAAGIPTPQQLTQKAFYNAARNYFTGVLTPGLGSSAAGPEGSGSSESSIDLPPFYNALPITAYGTPSLLVAAIDGKPRLASAGGIHPLTGARDWGSEIATLTTPCASTIILASNSGEAREDSLRAYELRGAEAAAVSEPLPLKGSIISFTPAATPTAVLATVRTGAQQYEVDRVSALCQ
jgi:hypothetical protein